MAIAGEIVTAAFGFAGVCVTAIVGYYTTRKAKDRLEQAEHEMAEQRQGLDFSRFLRDWGEVANELSSLMTDTEVDRFMIFRAWNGSIAPRWTTSVYQLRRGLQGPISYVHFELDSHYVDNLREIRASRPVLLVTDNLPPSAIKEVYLAEGVTSAYWEHIETATGESQRSVAITYCSFATHSGVMSPVTITRCKRVAHRLRASAMLFREDE